MSEKYPNKDTGFFSEIQNSKGGISKVPQWWEMADYAHDELRIRYLDGVPWQYQDGTFKSCDKDAVRKTIIELTLRQASPNQVRTFQDAISGHCVVDRNYLPDNTGLLNLANGVLDIKTKELKPHSPEYFFKYKLPHQFDPQATCSKWEYFLFEVFEGNQDLSDLMAEIFGYTMIGGDPWLHKAFMLFGDGRNGKSVLLSVLSHILGENNVSTVPIDKLNNPFSVVQADGKLANIVGETTAKEVDSEAFKTAVGGERLNAAQKYCPEYPMKFQARIIFAANRMPKLGDHTLGAYERMCIIPFNKTIPEAERDPNLAKKLYAEAPGIINWALMGLERLKQRGRLPKIKIVDEALNEFRQESDSIYDWVTQCIEPEAGKPHTFAPRDLYQNYREFCSATGRQAFSLNGFSKRVSKEVQKICVTCVTKTKKGIEITACIKISKYRANCESQIPWVTQR